MTARDMLEGINKKYRDYVIYPLTYIEVEESSIQLPDNCFIYRYITGDLLRRYLAGKYYVDRLIALNQVMSQLLKGKPLIYCMIHGLTIA
jgi:hypothetical protein